MEASAAALSGDLTFIGLGELLQLIGTSAGTGILTLKSPHVSQNGAVFIKSGNPVDALCGPLSGQEALFSLFGWIEGRFSFEQTPVNRPRAIRHSRMSLILDGIRLVDEGKVPKLGPRPLVELSSDTAQGGSWVPLLKGPMHAYGDVVDEDRFPEGSPIVVEGKHGQWIYAILDGEADLVKNTPKGPVTIMRLGPGAFAGFLSFLTDHKIRNADVIARKPVTAGVLNTDRLHQEWYERSLLFTDLIRALALRMVRQLDIFYDLGSDPPQRLTLADMAPVTQPVMFQSGLYRLDRGTGMLVTDMNGSPVAVEEVVKGDFIGKLPFVEGLEPMNGSLFGTPQFTVSPVDTHHVVAEFQASSPTLRQIIGHLTYAITATNQQLIRHLTSTGQAVPD